MNVTVTLCRACFGSVYQVRVFYRHGNGRLRSLGTVWLDVTPDPAGTVFVCDGQYVTTRPSRLPDGERWRIHGCEERPAPPPPVPDGARDITAPLHEVP